MLGTDLSGGGLGSGGRGAGRQVVATGPGPEGCGAEMGTDCCDGIKADCCRGIGLRRDAGWSERR